jgi:hypothetical protein
MKPLSLSEGLDVKLTVEPKDYDLQQITKDAAKKSSSAKGPEKAE